MKAELKSKASKRGKSALYVYHCFFTIICFFFIITDLPLRKAWGKGGKTATAWGQGGIAPRRGHHPTTTEYFFHEDI